MLHGTHRRAGDGTVRPWWTGARLGITPDSVGVLGPFRRPTDRFLGAAMSPGAASNLDIAPTAAADSTVAVPILVSGQLPLGYIPAPVSRRWYGPAPAAWCPRAMSGGLWAVSTWIQSPSAAGNPPAAARSQSATRHLGAYARSVERAGAWLLLACKARICLALGLDMETLEEGKNASQIWGPLMRRRSCGWGKYGRAGVGVMQAARRRRLMPGRSRRSKIATGAQLACLNVRLLWRCHPGSPLGTSSADHSTSVREPTLRFAPTASSVPALLLPPGGPGAYCSWGGRLHPGRVLPLGYLKQATGQRVSCRDEVRCGGSKQKPTQNRHGHQKIVFFKIR